jgi:alpha-glucoside transport system permease protein
MSTDTETVTAPQQKTDDAQKLTKFQPGRGLLGLLGMLIVVWFLANLFLAFGYYPQWFGHKIVIAVLALIAGVGGAALLSGSSTCSSSRCRSASPWR